MENEINKDIIRSCPVCHKLGKHWMGKWETTMKSCHYLQCQNCWSIINYEILDKRLSKRKSQRKKNESI